MSLQVPMGNDLLSAQLLGGFTFSAFVPSIGQDGPRLRLEKSLGPIEKNTPLPPYSLAFDPQDHGRLLATSMPSPYIALWKIDENVPSVFGDEKSGPVWRVAVDPEGRFVASATNDAAVRLWTGTDVDSAVELRGHLASVFAVDINPENRNIASASFDGTIRLWTTDSPLSPKLLSDSSSIPPMLDEFRLEASRISITGNDGKTYSGTLPPDFGEVSAAAVSANGKGIVVVPRSGRGHPVLLVTFSEHLVTASIPLYGVKAEWTAVAFIENDTRIAAKTKEGKIFSWPFYSDVGSLEQLAKERLPSVRDESGLDKRLTAPDYILRR
jgi:hypothetical protein